MAELTATQRALLFEINRLKRERHTTSGPIDQLNKEIREAKRQLAQKESEVDFRTTERSRITQQINEISTAFIEAGGDRQLLQKADYEL